MASSRSDNVAALLAIFGCFVLTGLIVIMSGAAIFFIYLCSFHVHPHFVNLDGVHANFTTTAATTNYNLDLSVSLRNPNTYYHVHHHKIEAMTIYNNPTDVVDALGIGTAVKLNSVSQKPKSNAVITPSFKGVISHEVDNLVVRLNLENKYKTRFLGWEVTSEFQCDLKVPSINGNNGQSTEEACKVIYHRRYTFPTLLKFSYVSLISLAPALFIWFSRSLGVMASFAALICYFVIG